MGGDPDDYVIECSPHASGKIVGKGGDTIKRLQSEHIESPLAVQRACIG